MSGTRYVFLCALLSTAFAVAQRPASPASVDDLVRLGLTGNKELLAVRERITEAQGLVVQAGVRPAPGLGLRGATGKPLGTQGEEVYSAEYTQPVETAGKRAKRVKVANFSVNAAEAELQERSAMLAFAIRSQHAELEAERQRLALLSEFTRQNNEALRLTEERVRAGDAPALEANLLRVEIARAAVQSVSARNRLASASLELLRLTGLPAGTNLPTIPAMPPPDLGLEELTKRAFAERADLRQAVIAEQQGAASVSLERANARPDLNLTAAYARQNSQFDDLFGTNAAGQVSPLRDRDDILTFGLLIPLKGKRSNQGNVDAASARTSGAHLRREFLERSIPVEVETAYQRLQSSKEALDLLQGQVMTPSAANLEVVREAYRLGQLRLLDVINEQRRLIDTQLAFIDAQADVQRSWAEVERSIGGNLP